MSEYLVSQLIKDLPEKQLNVKDLCRIVEKRSDKRQSHYSVLLGAGASVTSGINSAEGLVRDWRREVFEELFEEQVEYDADFAKEWLTETQPWYQPEKEYATLFEKQFRLAAQRRVFVEDEVKDTHPSIGYAYLSSLVTEKFFNTIFTTNFDDLINEAFYRYSDERPIVCAHDSSAQGITLSSVRPKIIKLHGDYLFNDLKCTPDETQDLTENMKDKFQQFLREFGLIVSGYSGSDDSIMNVLTTLIEDPNYIENGVYWCLRKDSVICKNLLEFLKKERVFFVVTDGFDELFAELHAHCVGPRLILPEAGIDGGASSSISIWTNNPQLANSKNNVLQNQLSEFLSSKTNGQLANAIASLVSEDSNEPQKIRKFSDQETKVLFELKKHSKQKKYEQLIEHAKKHLDSTENKLFKFNLLEDCYAAYNKLDDISGAQNICEELILLYPDDPRNNIREANLCKDPDKKIEQLNKAIKKDAYFWYSQHELGEALMLKAEYSDGPDRDALLPQILDAFNKSLQFSPGLGNPSWQKKFDALKGNTSLDEKDTTNELANLIDKLLLQDPYDSKTCKLLFKFCKHFSDTKYKEIELFQHYKDALKKSYPKYNSNLFEWIVEAAIEFRTHEAAKEAWRLIKENNDEIELSATFYLAQAEFFIEIKRDLDSAIGSVKEGLREFENPRLANKLVNLYLFAKNVDLAENALSQYGHLLSKEVKTELKSNIYLAQEKYDEALAQMDELLSDPFHDEKYTAHITYIYLKKGDYFQVNRIGNAFLEKHPNHRERFPEVVINYEYARSMLGKKPDNRRLSAICESKKDEDAKAMALLLLGKDSECLSIMLEQAAKKYSTIYHYRDWPVAANVLPQFNREMGIPREVPKVVAGQR